MGQFRNEPMRLGAGRGVSVRVESRHVDAETFAEAQEYNERVRGMAGAAIRNDDGELLLIHHEDYGGWVLPGGVVESGESFGAAAMREAAEESGVDARLVAPLLVFHFVARHDGQSTDNFFVLFEGEARDSETAQAPGLGYEPITDTQWTDTIPDGVAEDRTVRQTMVAVADRFERIEARTDLLDGYTDPFES
jgi:ADP-ribose pyrophosphatase YjhB (NUDIX family)